MSDYRRSRQLSRSYLLLALLRHGGRRLERLAEETGVTPRTIRRDLIAFQQAGLPITRTEVGLWKLLKGFSCPICGGEAHK